MCAYAQLCVIVFLEGETLSSREYAQRYVAENNLSFRAALTPGPSPNTGREE
jgi:hypothetical protein